MPAIASHALSLALAQSPLLSSPAPPQCAGEQRRHGDTQQGSIHPGAAPYGSSSKAPRQAPPPEASGMGTPTPGPGLPPPTGFTFTSWKHQVRNTRAPQTPSPKSAAWRCSQPCTCPGSPQAPELGGAGWVVTPARRIPRGLGLAGNPALSPAPRQPAWPLQSSVSATGAGWEELARGQPRTQPPPRLSPHTSRGVSHAWDPHSHPHWGSRRKSGRKPGPSQARGRAPRQGLLHPEPDGLGQDSRSRALRSPLPAASS